MVVYIEWIEGQIDFYMLKALKILEIIQLNILFTGS